MKERLASVPVLGWLLRVQERFGEIKGTALANGIALQTFISIFPLIIVAIAVIGFVSADDPMFGRDVVNELGLTGDEAESMIEAIDNAKESRQAASIIGLAGLLFSDAGVCGRGPQPTNLLCQCRQLILSLQGGGNY